MFPAVMFPLSPVGAIMFPLFREFFSSLYAYALRCYVSARHILGPNILFFKNYLHIFLLISGASGENLIAKA